MTFSTSHNFKNERQELLHLAVLLDKYLYEEINKLAKKFNISSQQFVAMRMIYATHPLSQSVITIRDNMPNKMSDITRLIGRLEEDGYVKKIINKDDKRVKEVSLTLRGLSLMKKMDEPYDEIYEFIQLTDEEVGAFNTIIKKILI
jgi:DNA-binding MarR family transcriptional regulator